MHFNSPCKSTPPIPEIVCTYIWWQKCVRHATTRYIVQFLRDVKFFLICQLAKDHELLWKRSRVIYTIIKYVRFCYWLYIDLHGGKGRWMSLLNETLCMSLWVCHTKPASGKGLMAKAVSKVTVLRLMLRLMIMCLQHKVSHLTNILWWICVGHVHVQTHAVQSLFSSAVPSIGARGATAPPVN